VSSTRDLGYQYPTNIRRVVLTLIIFVLTFNLLEYLLAWTRAFYAWLYLPLHLPYIPFLEPFHFVPSSLLTAHLGLFVALIFVRALAFLVPRVYLQSNGLLMTSALGRRFVPYTALRGIRSTELQPNGRFVVWVNSTAALPLQNFLAALIFGHWFWRGFLLTSDLDGFDNVIATIAARLKQRYGEEGFAARFVEAQPTWQLRMFNAPVETIRAVATEETLPITQRDAIWHTVSFVTSLLLPMIVSAIIHWQIPWGAVIVLSLAIAEVPLAALYLTAVPLTDLRHITFQDALRVYPLTQLPRWLIAIALTLLIGAGIPFPLMTFIILFAIVPGVLWVTQLTEAWFEVKFPESLLGALVTVIYQVLVYELFLVMLPR
jgi:hypothetical protein